MYDTQESTSTAKKVYPSDKNSVIRNNSEYFI